MISRVVPLLDLTFLDTFDHTTRFYRLVSFWVFEFLVRSDKDVST